MKILTILAILVPMLSTQAVFAQESAQAPAAPKEKFSGFMFGDFFYNIGRDPAFLNGGSLPSSASAGEKDYKGFQFRRIYFTYDNDISDRFTARLRLEMDASGARDIKVVPFLKDAYLKWKNVYSGADLIFGVQPTTAFEVSEGAWGYRSLEKTIIDLRGIVSARDLGIGLRGKFDGSGTVNYWLLVANGNGNKNVPKDKYQRYAATLHLKPAANVQVTVLGDLRAQAPVADPNNPGRTLGNDVLTAALFAGYNDPGNFSVGAEAFLQSTANGFTPSTSTARKGLNAMGVSAWATVNLDPAVALVGRYDYFDPNGDSDLKASGDARNLIIGALAWKPDKNVTVMPNVEVETYESLPDPAGTSYDASVTGRLTVFYNFL